MIEVKIGDCTDRLKDLEDNSVDAIICDPPYGLKFMSKGWDDIGDGSQQREWHRGWLSEAHRVLKPNGVLKAFSGTRTFHHLIAMMEEIGFSDLRIEAWAYGSGFPKSHNVALGIYKKYGHGNRGSAIASGSKFHATTGEPRKSGELLPKYKSKSFISKDWDGWGTALKPAFEPVIIGYKPK